MSLVLEKEERVTMRGKSRGEIRGEDDMRGGDGPGKSDRVATIEALMEKEKGIMIMSPQQEDIINKLEPKVRFRVF